ncbi:hypothetical protein [Methylobrevis pamukkalensis]|uniref:hypothetical protein n=1 Tax=Methylobrevis pamukkalensis TaxID=1439726 RepID=UPI00114CB6BE|nr:hypothetical protein [Methylobrevis pamukkalensis]
MSNLFFKTAIAMLVVGMGAGIGMSVMGDHTIYSAHAHLNLLGFVVTAVYGTYFGLNPARAEGLLPKAVWAFHTLGTAVMFPALSLLLLGHGAAEPVVALSSIAVFVAALGFMAAVFRPVRNAARRGALVAAE